MGAVHGPPFFDGQREEAFRLYEKVLGGEFRYPDDRTRPFFGRSARAFKAHTGRIPTEFCRDRGELGHARIAK
jgi:hypothetical protein